MNKLELNLALKNEAGISKRESARVVDLFFGTIANALANGGRVEVRGLCSFYVKKYKAYSGMNPKTKEQIKVKPKKLPFFKCGKELKERVDYQKNKTITVTNSVLSIINRSKKGVGIAILKEKTGFDDSKIYSVVKNLKKQGKIKSIKRGVYKKV